MHIPFRDCNHVHVKTEALLRHQASWKEKKKVNVSLSDVMGVVGAYSELAPSGTKLNGVWGNVTPNLENLTCSPTMLPNLATMLANKFRSKNVRGMFVHYATVTRNVREQCCPVWPSLDVPLQGNLLDPGPFAQLLLLKKCHKQKFPGKTP